MPFYAVAKGRTTGIFMTWPDCETQVKGFPGARYKKFDTVVGAQEFIASIGGITAPQKDRKSTNNSINKSTNLKRNHSTSANNYQKKTSDVANKKSKKPDSEESFDDEDLNVILNKQMDDIEERLKKSEKDIKNIVRKSAGSSRKTIMIDHSEVKRPTITGINNIEFQVDSEGFVQVYTDGACSANGRNGAKAGLGVYWGDDHSLNAFEPVSGRATNNCGEIQAATKAIKIALEHGIQRLAINTDSKFLINSVTKWIPGWKRKGWKLASGEPVKNTVDFKDLDSVLNKLEIKWNYVEAHKGVHGNEMADLLAKAGSALYDK